MGNWDRQWVGENGNLNATYYISEPDYAFSWSAYNTEPVGDKQELPAQVFKDGPNYVVAIDGLRVASVPITWTRLDGRLKNGPIDARATIQWRAYDEPPRFMLKLYIKNA